MIERTFVEQGIKRVELEEFLSKKLEKAGFTESEVVKTPLVTRIIVNVIKPGLAIGKSGANIRKLTEMIESLFGIENPQLEIRELSAPELDATAMVNRVRALIERGFSWRSVSYRLVKDIESKGAQGIEIILAGKLTGKGGRKRKQRIAVGYMKKVGDQVKLVDYAKATAYPKAGAIGIKLRIVRPETVFPDKISIQEVLDQRKEQEEKKEEDEKEKEEKEKAKTGKEIKHGLKEVEEGQKEKAETKKKKAKDKKQKQADENKKDKKQGKANEKQRETAKKTGAKEKIKNKTVKQKHSKRGEEK